MYNTLLKIISFPNQLLLNVISLVDVEVFRITDLYLFFEYGGVSNINYYRVATLTLNSLSIFVGITCSIFPILVSYLQISLSYLMVHEKMKQYLCMSVHVVKFKLFQKATTI